MKWRRLKLGVSAWLVMLLVPVCFASHETDKPSDGTIGSFREVNPPRSVPDAPFSATDESV